MISIQTTDFDSAFKSLRFKFKSTPRIAPLRWQGCDVGDKPEMQTYELFNVVLHIAFPRSSLAGLVEDIKPNLPWADDHFLERVGRRPLNPGKTWEYWPFNKSADKFRDMQGQFNHSYMERFWPKFARHGDMTAEEREIAQCNRGLRHTLGDLDDVLTLIERDPLTRQAYLPIFFPEDTGIGDGGRKPCTLGYHFIMRGGQLNLVYHMRSCDYVRHLRDDCYLAMRLLMWVLGELQARDRWWKRITVGSYTMTMTSLHMFVNDFHMLQQVEPT